MARCMLAATALLAAALHASGLYTDSAAHPGVPADAELFSRVGGNGTDLSARSLSRRRRFFAPLPAGATFILTPKFTMPLPGLVSAGSMLNVEVPLSFALPTASADPARYKTTDGEEGDDSYTYYRRSLDDDKASMYSYAETFISQFGLDGKMCVLRTICEVAETPVQDAGLMGEIFNTVLRTTMEPTEGERMQEYKKAEERGRAVGRCDEYYSACPVSVFQLV
ncbi:uncharacterized protein LOC122379371 [Amphibalanus amphitrite]|nr:uncharacterized protein LOC122379371 [Amphibalanus amphitrite]